MILETHVELSRSQDLHQTVDCASRRTTIDARSWPDRRAIVAQSARDCGALSAKLELFHRGIDGAPLQLHQTVFDQESTTRSTHDRGPIAARSGLFLKRNRGLFKANPEAMAPLSETVPTTPQIRSHDRFNCPRSSG